MSRIGASQDPQRWHAKVRRWLEKDFARLNRERILEGLKPLKAVVNKNPTNTRHFREIDLHLRRVVGIDDSLRIQSAHAILAYFYSANKNGQEIHPQVARFIEAARLRHGDDPKRNHKMARALGLMRTTSGNSGTFSKLHSMSEDAVQEAEQALVQADGKRKGGKRKISTFTAKVEKLAERMDVSVTTIWLIVDRLKREGKITNQV